MSGKYNLPVIMVLAATAASAQSSGTAFLSVRSADEAAAHDATGRRSHGQRSNSPAARLLGKEAFTERGHGSAQAATSGSGAGGGLRFPGDLSFGGGPVVTFAQSHAIYLNPVSPSFPNGSCTVATCWGDPEAFLRDLGQSDFIHITDQYVNQRTDNRYTVGKSATINYVQGFAALSDSDILAQVHAAAASTGQVGYGHIYHVFLPPGQDVCQTAGICASNAICAYHGSADFFDIGHVLYSVEPDQIGFGCGLPPGTPNGTRIDSTNNVLSHELFEIITDPDFDAWFNTATLDQLGEEIGDECEFLNAVFSFDVPAFRIGSKLYAVQSEYDNKQHGCATKSGN
jgi:hypothetical protein